MAWLKTLISKQQNDTAHLQLWDPMHGFNRDNIKILKLTSAK